MKWLVLALFAVAFASSFAWHEAAERNLTRAQGAACGLLALATWTLVLVLGGLML